MSVFQVTLNNTAQGLLDINPVTGLPFATSHQREVYINGPHRINRLLKDGQQFTDSNYYKRYVAAPLGTATAETAFLTIVSDDGSVWNDYDQTANTYPLVYNLTVDNGTTYADNVADILTDTGGYAVYTQVTNQENHDIKMRINGVAIVDLAGDTTQIFNHGDLSINLLEFDNSASGAVTTTVQVLLSVLSVSNS